MKLSTRVRYGVRAMIELASYPEGEIVSLNNLAQKQRISNKYLEPMMTSLKIAGLVESVRGKLGGYRLAVPAKSITLWDIYANLDTSSELIECLHQQANQKSSCPLLNICVAHEVWAELSEAMVLILKSKNIKDLAKRQKQLKSRVKTTK